MRFYFIAFFVWGLLGDFVSILAEKSNDTAKIKVGFFIVSRGLTPSAKIFSPFQGLGFCVNNMN
jgi:hypothetical protein